METLFTFFVFLSLQIIFLYFWYKNGVKAGEKNIKNLTTYCFYQGDELAIILKKKNNHYELKVICKDLVKIK